MSRTGKTQCNVIDLRKDHKEQFYTGKKMLDYEMGEAVYLSVEGVGPPGEQPYMEAIQALYSVVYTAKFTLKAKGELDYKILPLECNWGDFEPNETPPEEWQWSLQIRVPAQLTSEHVQAACDIIREKKGLELVPPDLVTDPPTRYLHLLHVGPIEQLGETYARLKEAAREKGLEPVRGRCREAYLSDPRRVPPERLKTIVRLAVR